MVPLVLGNPHILTSGGTAFVVCPETAWWRQALFGKNIMGLELQGVGQGFWIPVAHKHLEKIYF